MDISILSALDWTNISRLFLYDPTRPLLFNSGVFAVLFVLLLLFYQALANRVAARTWYLLLFSLYFYYKSSGLFFLLLLGTSASDFLLAQWMDSYQRKGSRLAILCISLVLDLGILVYFKYTNFALGLWNDMAGDGLSFQDVVLPVGISFYTFQTLSYTIDVYRGKLKPLTRIHDYWFYVSFFPHLVAGPIVKASLFLPQIRQRIRLRENDLAKATLLIIGGLVKKCVIADYISANFVDRIFEQPLLYSGAENLMAIYGYALQIYCDFSGYSDMAIGIALLLGFDLGINFLSPYRATSITDFWRRWHISLSTWLRDFLYIPLGGNRKGPFRQNLNLFLTMLIGGLWHGASLKFVFWGGMHGLALIADKGRIALKIPGNGFTRFLLWAFTFHFVCFCWIFFRAESFAVAWQVLEQVGTKMDMAVWPQLFQGYPVVFGLMAFGYVLHAIPDRWEAGFILGFQRMPILVHSLLLACTVWLVIQTQSADVQPFIYFQF